MAGFGVKTEVVEGHMVPDPEVTIRLQSRIAAFFKQHLGEVR